MQIRTNNVPRPIVSGHDLTSKQRDLASLDYDFLGLNFMDSSFIVYRGHVHYLGNFIHMDIVTNAGWTGIESDGMFGGTIIRLADDGETAVMGYATTTTTSGSPGE